MEIIDVECSRLNKLYLEGNAEEYTRSFGNLLDTGRDRKKTEYLQTAQGPRLKAQIKIDKKGTCDLVSCIYETNCGASCDFKKRI